MTIDEMNKLLTMIDKHPVTTNAYELPYKDIWTGDVRRLVRDIKEAINILVTLEASDGEEA